MNTTVQRLTHLLCNPKSSFRSRHIHDHLLEGSIDHSFLDFRARRTRIDEYDRICLLPVNLVGVSEERVPWLCVLDDGREALNIGVLDTSQCDSLALIDLL